MFHAYAARFDVTDNLEIFLVLGEQPCLDAPKILKVYKIPHHIESLDACMEH